MPVLCQTWPSFVQNYLAFRAGPRIPNFPCLALSPNLDHHKLDPDHLASHVVIRAQPRHINFLITMVVLITVVVELMVRTVNHRILVPTVLVGEIRPDHLNVIS